MTVYNEIDPFAAEWLRQLIASSAITPGAVLEKPIAEVTAGEVSGHNRVHLFAGIGGWDLALTLAGWPSEWPVWTGSCPCQPWSLLGKRKGFNDERHGDAWPEFLRLARECRPFSIFGEQVENAVRWGWLDRISADLEAEGYAIGAAVLGAHSAGAPHRRQRLYWVAIDCLDDPQRTGLEGHRGDVISAPAVKVTPQGGGQARHAAPTGIAGDASGVGALPMLRGILVQHSQHTRLRLRLSGNRQVGLRPVHDAWSGATTLDLRDGTRRRAEPGTCPVAYGVPAHVGRLRGYGNAIVPQAAALLIRAVIDLLHGRITDE